MSKFEKWVESIERDVDRIVDRLTDPEFWKVLGVFAALLAAACGFIWVAAGFDVMAKSASGFGSACRALGDAQALALFVSPFAIGISSLVAAGELLSQMEERRRYQRPLRWGKIMLSFGLAGGMLLSFAVLMRLWC